LVEYDLIEGLGGYGRVILPLWEKVGLLSEPVDLGEWIVLGVSAVLGVIALGEPGLFAGPGERSFCPVSIARAFRTHDLPAGNLILLLGAGRWNLLSSTILPASAAFVNDILYLEGVKTKLRPAECAIDKNVHWI
jgi:hypothetical protein